MRFTITCKQCGNTNIAISEYHNEYGDGVRFRCPNCGNKEDIT